MAVATPDFNRLPIIATARSSVRSAVVSLLSVPPPIVGGNAYGGSKRILKIGLPSFAVKILDTLIPRVILDSTVNLSSIHGPTHWARVERNGLYLAPSVGANERVVALFAYLHDCRRRNDGIDPGHGPRAGRYAMSIRKTLSVMTDSEVRILVEACDGHTRRRKTNDPTIAVCWDADRLDLPRVGIRPRPYFFNTPLAIEMVNQRDLSPLDSLEPRSITVQSQF